MPLLREIGSALLSPITSVINTALTNRSNRKMAEFAYNKDLESWNRQNTYNSPAAQMARYSTAGLNPNLIYGTGSASAGNATSIPHYQAPTQSHNYEAPQMLPVLGSFADLKIKAATYDRIKAETESTKLGIALNAASLEYDKMGRYFKSESSARDYELKANKADMSMFDVMMKRIQARIAQNLEPDVIEAFKLNNQLKGKTLERYSSDITGINLSNQFKQMQNTWYGRGGIKGIGDVLPWIKLLFSK